MTIVLRQQFYTSFTNLLCNLINFYVIHDVKVIFYIKFQIPFLNKIAQKYLYEQILQIRNMKFCHIAARFELSFTVQIDQSLPYPTFLLTYLNLII